MRTLGELQRQMSKLFEQLRERQGHLSKEAATEQDPQGNPQEFDEEVRRALRGGRRG